MFVLECFHTKAVWFGKQVSGVVPSLVRFIWAGVNTANELSC